MNDKHSDIALVILLISLLLVRLYRLRLSSDKTTSDHQALRQEFRQLKVEVAEKEDLKDQVEK